MHGTNSLNLKLNKGYLKALKEAYAFFDYRITVADTGDGMWCR